jgi:putative heme iron utilization protein
MNPSSDLSLVQEACKAFPSRFQTLHLGTVSDDGQPEASYAPYVHEYGRYWVYLSDLARHTANLRANGRASVLFIEGEVQAKHLFARERLTLRCVASECPRASDRFETVLDCFEQRFGHFMQAIRPLQDFRLFELAPLSGAYVAGFARAYSFEGDDPSRLRHRNEQGHQVPDAVSARRLDASLPS